MADEHPEDLTRRALLARSAAAALPLVTPAPGVAPPRPRPPHALAAFQRGMEAYRRYTAASNAQARAWFAQALALDPHYAQAQAMLAATHRQDGNMAWSADRDRSERLAVQLAYQAVALARQAPPPQAQLPEALEQLGWVLVYRGDHQGAIQAAQEAVQARPSFAEGYALWAHILSYQGEPQAAVEKMEEALRLRPHHSFLFDYNLGHAYVVWGYMTAQADPRAALPYYRLAETHLRAAIRRNPEHRPAGAYLAVVLWTLGQQAEARHQMALLRAAGRPQASQDLARFRDYCRRSLPHTDSALLNWLIEVWGAAEAQEPA